MNTTTEDIFEYWKDKCITDKGEVAIEGSVDYSSSIAVVEDWGEPCCFACRKYLVSNENDEDIGNPDKIWNQKKLRGAERAHIIPKALSGEDAPENLFILCRNCHAESPDTRFKSEFFRWVYRRRKRPSAYVLAFNECVNRGILPLFDANDIKNGSTHGASMVDSTRIAAFVGAAEERNHIMPKLGCGLDGKMFQQIWRYATGDGANG